MLVAPLLIVLVVGAQYYVSVRQDQKEARKLLNRELTIVEQRMLYELREAENSLNDLHNDVLETLNRQNRFEKCTHDVMVDNNFIRAAAIAFVPNYFKAQGYWYEVYTMRVGDSLETDLIGGMEHDYTAMAWYNDGLTTTRRYGVWSMPYIDFDDNSYIMSVSRPVIKDSTTVAVICVDIALSQLKDFLHKAEPYPGSVCTLISKQGNVIVSSSDEKIDINDYFVDNKPISIGGMSLSLACPKDSIYGETEMINLIVLGLLLVGMTLLLFMVQRMVTSFLRLNNARQQQQAMDREMSIAHDIQMDILRTDFPKGLSATLLPMKEVGGDLYDYCQRDGKLYFIIGDVSGKGIPAAMMMTATVNLFRMASMHYSTPVEIMREINHVLAERNPNMMFVTAFVGKIDMQHGLLTYCNAGHNPPLLDGKSLRSDPDIPLGYQPSYVYRQHGVPFGEGSLMVLYTDGITELRNEHRQMLRVQGLVNITFRHQSENVKQLTRSIIRDTHKHAGNAVPTDDMTLMCIANDTPQQHPSLQITNNIEALSLVKDLVRDYSYCAGMDKHQMHQVTLSVEEAVANIINYAYPRDTIGKIDIDIRIHPPKEDEDGELIIETNDYGQPFDPTERRDFDVEQNVDNRQVGGLGIYLYQTLMDSVDYHRTADGRNVLVMFKRLKE